VPTSSEATIVHGDHRLGNAMFAHGAPARLTAVFDWELATIGDPLATSGYLVTMWAEPGDPEGLLKLSAATTAPGYPTRQELIERHAERSGRSIADIGWYAALALRYYSAAHLRRVAPVIAGGRTAREPELLQAHATQRLAAPPSLWGYQSQLFAMTGWTSALWLHKLRQPTLVLTGDEDPLVPLANARFLARRIPQARLEVVRGGGHLFLLDQPRDAAGAITRFLSEPTIKEPTR
jgi:pimeloyl-ACP methyl ester carboxylesterase